MTQNFFGGKFGTKHKELINKTLEKEQYVSKKEQNSKEKGQNLDLEGLIDNYNSQRVKI